MTDQITTPAQMREALDAALADYTPGVDCAVRFVTIDQVDMLVEFYLHNRALPMAEPEPLAVKVKPLVWTAVGAALWARDIYGDHYEIETNDGAVVLDHPRLYGDYAIASIDTAQAAAEADHAARIRSQIDAVPAAQVRAEAMEEAAKLADAITERLWHEYKTERHFATDHLQGMSDGAGEVADAIRALMEKPE